MSEIEKPDFDESETSSCKDFRVIGEGIAQWFDRIFRLFLAMFSEIPSSPSKLLRGAPAKILALVNKIYRLNDAFVAMKYC